MIHKPNQAPQANTGRHPSSDDSYGSELPFSSAPRGRSSAFGKIMKLSLILGACLVLTSARAGEPPMPRIDGHGDGQISLSVAIRAVDALSGVPISDVTVTFYDKVDLDLLMSIDGAQKNARMPQAKAPAGVVARTSRDGIATLTCKFDAAFLWSFESGERKDVGINVFPSGRFVVSIQGYRTLDRTAREIFSAPPYSPDQLKFPVTLQLEKDRT